MRYQRHDHDKDSRRRAAFIAASLPSPVESKPLPAWLMALMAQDAEEQRVARAEVQEAADRAAFQMRLVDQRFGAADEFLASHKCYIKSR